MNSKKLNIRILRILDLEKLNLTQTKWKRLIELSMIQTITLEIKDCKSKLFKIILIDTVNQMKCHKFLRLLTKINLKNLKIIVIDALVLD